MRLRLSCLLVLPLLAITAFADPILGPNLSTFAILGGAGVAINGTGSVINGSIGACCNATAVTGVIPTNFNISGGTVQMGGATATSGQLELTTAITALGGLAPGTPESLLGGLTLGPGVYSSASSMDLTGVLTLDGGGNSSALWVFLVGSSFTMGSGSVVNVINTGSGAGVYWVMGAGSATIGSNSTIVGNILANQAITLYANVTDSCGRILTRVAAVTLTADDTVGIGCSGILAGSNGLSGGGTIIGGVVVPTKPTTPPNGGVPEPATVALLGSALLTLAGVKTLRSRLGK